LLKNLITNPSRRKLRKIVLITKPLDFVFFFTGFSGKTSIAEHFINSPILATLPFAPL
jgi:hypothetical protein